MIDLKVAEVCSAMLQGLGEPTRIQIIDILRGGSRHVTEISRLMEEEVVNVSHHLGVLRDTGLVVTRKDGRFVIYSLNPSYFRNDASNTTCLELGWCRVEIAHH